MALTGTEEEIRRVATDYKVFFEKVPLPGTKTYAIDHTPYTFLLDREGKFVILFPPGTPADRMWSHAARAACGGSPGTRQRRQVRLL